MFIDEYVDRIYRVFGLKCNQDLTKEEQEVKIKEILSKMHNEVLRWGFKGGIRDSIHELNKLLKKEEI